jgi:hypothetical protein
MPLNVDRFAVKLCSSPMSARTQLKAGRQPDTCPTSRLSGMWLPLDMYSRKAVTHIPLYVAAEG